MMLNVIEIRIKFKKADFFIFYRCSDKSFYQSVPWFHQLLLKFNPSGVVGALVVAKQWKCALVVGQTGMSALVKLFI